MPERPYHVKNSNTIHSVPQEDFFNALPERFALNLYAMADGEDWRIEGLQYCLDEQERLGFIRILTMTSRAAVIDVYDPDHVEFFRASVMGNA